MRRLLLALALTVGAVVAVPPPAEADLAPAMFWCTAYKPHTGDDMGPPQLNYYWFLASNVVIARCYATHPAAPAHWYWVYVYSDGSSAWAPKDQDSW